MRNYVWTLVFWMSCVTPSIAQWINKTENDPFSDGKKSISLTMAAGYGFDFTCEGKNEYRLVFLTTESATDGINSGNLLSPKMKVRVDELPIIDLDAELDEAGGKARVSSTDTKVIDVVKSIASARQRVAVAVEIGGKRFHTQNFGTAGSKDALSKALRACKLDPTSEK